MHWTMTMEVIEHMRNRGLSAFDMLGLLPEMLSDHDPRPAKEQLDEGYQHGGGWRPFRGFAMTYNPPALRYPNDPPMRLIAETRLRDERVMLFESSWVVIVQPDDTFEVSRMD